MSLAAPFTGWERRTQRAFRALLQALAYPGRPVPLPTRTPREALRLLGETLVDEGVGVHAPPWLRGALKGVGVREAPPERAGLVFLEGFGPEVLDLLPRLARGTPLEPEGGATLFLPVRLDRGGRVALRGPGIPGERPLQADLPPEFWRTRAALLDYPLGWELFLTDGRQVVGLPRTTEVKPWDT